LIVHIVFTENTSVNF